MITVTVNQFRLASSKDYEESYFKKVRVPQLVIATTFACTHQGKINIVEGTKQIGAITVPIFVHKLLCT